MGVEFLRRPLASSKLAFHVQFCVGAFLAKNKYWSQTTFNKTCIRNNVHRREKIDSGKNKEFCHKNVYLCIYCKKILTTHSFPENPGWGSEVEWSTGWVYVTALSQEREVLQFVSENRKLLAQHKI